MKRFGNFIICVNFIDNSENIVYFSSENLCHDWVNTSFEVGLHYKPLFIVIMYFMCASILIPIAIIKHLMKKYTIEKKKKPGKKDEAINLDQPSKEMEALERTELIPQVKTHELKSGSDTHKKVVLFDIESDQSDQDPDQEDETEREAEEKSIHILNYKPWISSNKRELTWVGERKNLHNSDQNFARKSCVNNLINRNKFQSLSNLDTHQRNVNKNRSTTTVYYESNV